MREKESRVRLLARYIRQVRTVGPGEAGRRLREKLEDERIRAELKRKDFLTPEERRAQEAAKPARKIRFRVRVIRGEAGEDERQEMLRSLEEQTYREYTIHPDEEEPTAESYTVFIEPDGYLHPGALYETAKAISESGADLVYTDEAFFRKTPKDLDAAHFKPDYGPDTLRGCNTAGPMTVCADRLIEETGTAGMENLDADGRWDATIRLAEAAKKPVHIPKILYYRRTKGDGAPTPALRRISDPINGEPLVSILIPNKDHREDLERCIGSIREKTTYPRYEIIIIENNSTEEETFRYYAELEKDERIRVIRREGAFNYSAVNNAGFRAAKGEQILLLNNDTEVRSPEWLEEMLMFAGRKDVGAVGAKLYYPDGTIQHAGIGIGIKMLAGHYHKGFPGDSPGYYGRLQYAQNVSAVTGACMMIPRHVYEEMNGLDESFSVVFNDVDLCLRIREAGYLIVWTPWAELTHYESKSRGADEETPEKKAFFVGETNRFLRKWYRTLEQGDPYYNPNLSRWAEDFSAR